MQITRTIFSRPQEPAPSVGTPVGVVSPMVSEGVVRPADGAGQGDAFTPNSSIYFINRDPAWAIRRGRQIFQRKFTVE